ncbi:MAG: helix-turn-helix transcriptional regulator [Candidatus Marinimicrobia bacterium]|nr:helix-turn-helix transcriptional regulator [Candidatus Neomarinimicrobiota bacterium]
MRPKYDIKNNLKLYRLKTGDITQEQLAAMVDSTRQTILSIEKGRYTPSVGLALRISQVLGATVEELFQLEEGEDDR